MVVVLDGKAFEAALVEVADSGGAVCGVVSLGVGEGDPSHEV